MGARTSTGVIRATRGKTLVGVEAFDQLTQYWRGLQARADGAVPTRASFNPAEIVPLLPHIFLLERKSDSHLEIRICGTALDELTGVPVSGLNYLDVCPPDQSRIFKRVMHQVLAVPCGARLEREVTFKSGRSFVFRSQGFPLADADGIPRYYAGLLKSLRPMTFEDMKNGPIIGSVFQKLDYIDLGFGIPQPDTMEQSKDEIA